MQLFVWRFDDEIGWGAQRKVSCSSLEERDDKGNKKKRARLTILPIG